jgi:hypothetical protein
VVEQRSRQQAWRRLPERLQRTVQPRPLEVQLPAMVLLALLLMLLL